MGGCLLNGQKVLSGDPGGVKVFGVWSFHIRNYIGNPDE
jgi:hypothetical protein